MAAKTMQYCVLGRKPSRDRSAVLVDRVGPQALFGRWEMVRCVLPLCLQWVEDQRWWCDRVWRIQLRPLEPESMSGEVAQA